MQKIGHYVLRGTIELLSGTRIGGSDDVLQIGGTDLTCIRDSVSGSPYIPGSSLKGRMRSCLEKSLGKTSGRGDEPCGCVRPDCPVCRIFGPHKKTQHDLGPTRLIVRDAPLLGGFELFENKTESTIRRDTGAAQHPRTVERVPPGATFSLEIGVQVYDIDSQFKYRDFENKDVTGADALIEAVCHAIGLVEDTGIGSGVGKGYGRVRIELTEEVEVTRRPKRPTRAGASVPAGEGTPG